jgi:hypothetical protein
VLERDKRQTWIYIVMPHGVGGVDCENGIVKVAPPIFKWMEGKRVEQVLAWAMRKGYQAKEYKEQQM